MRANDQYIDRYRLRGLKRGRLAVGLRRIDDLDVCKLQHLTLEDCVCDGRQGMRIDVGASVVVGSETPLPTLAFKVKGFDIRRDMGMGLGECQ